jgi:hypothetical protein
MRSTVAALVVVLVMITIQSCAEQKRDRPFEERYVAAVRAVSHVNLGSIGESRDFVQSHLYAILLTHDSVAELRGCFWAVEELRGKDRSQDQDPQSDSPRKGPGALRPGEAITIAQMVVIHRVSLLRTGEAGQLLVELFSNPDLGWDCETLLSLGRAITRCGPACLPFLEPIGRESLKQGHIARKFIGCIKAGRIYG